MLSEVCGSLPLTFPGLGWMRLRPWASGQLGWTEIVGLERYAFQVVGGWGKADVALEPKWPTDH